MFLCVYLRIEHCFCEVYDAINMILIAYRQIPQIALVIREDICLPQYKLIMFIAS